MIIHIVVFVVGFIAGALVFRNNKSKSEAVIERAKSHIDDLRK